MKNQFGKFVDQFLSEKLEKLYPKIVRCNEKLIRGDVAFAVPTTFKLVSGYIILVRDHHGRDRFTIEVGWSTKGRFPDLPRPSGWPSVKRVEFLKEEYICRLSNIWSKKDYWWGKDDERKNTLLTCGDELKTDQNDSLNCELRAAKQVADAVDHISRYGLPYLEEFFASKQVSRA